MKGFKAYDECGGIYKDMEDTTTKWSQIYKYNFIIYLIIACVNACACLCVPCAPAISCPGCCFFFSGIPTMTAFILTGYRLKNEGGSLCAEHDLVYGTAEDGTALSFASDAELMRKLWIAQMALYVPAGVCTSIGGILSILTFAQFKDNYDRADIF